MKLFVIAALIAVSAAARLEHLEQQQQALRSYLPPAQGSSFGSNGFGSHGSSSFGSNSFGSNGAFGAASAGQPSFAARGAFPPVSNQYLPPDQGSSASAGTPQFAGSLNGFGALSAQQFPPTYGQQAPQYQPQYQEPQAPSNSFARYQQPAVNRQYLAPHSQQAPQQAFDEQTGYHY